MTLLKTFQEEQDKEFDEKFRVPKPFDDGMYAIKADTFLSYIHLRESSLLKRIVEEMEKMRVENPFEQIQSRYDDNDAKKAKTPRVAEMLGRQAGYNQSLDDVKNILQ